MNNTLIKMLEHVSKKYPLIQAIEISTEELLFEERVKMACFYCGKYNRSWKCPPNLPNINYRRMFSEYENAAFVYLYMDLKSENYDDVRNNSSIMLHKALLQMEKYLWDHDNSTAISFIGGSCKLCKNGCGELKCNNPYMARSPLEATGVNIIKSAQKYGIDIGFPPKEQMMRIGMLLW